MTEFKVQDPLECFSPKWNEEKQEWEFYHLLSGRTYDAVRVVYFRLCTNMKMMSLYESYRQNALECAKYHLSPVFFLHWVRQMHVLNAINYAEGARYDYVVENPKKGKQSEAVYTKAYDEFMDKYKKEM